MRLIDALSSMRSKYSDMALRNSENWMNEGLYDEMNDILVATGLISFNSVKRIAYHLEYGICGHVLCAQCGVEPCKWSNGKYSETCSTRCAGIFNKERVKKTNMERYGVDNPSKSDLVKNRIRESNLERYGFDNAMKNDEVRKRQIESYSSVDMKSVVEKRKNTNMSRYGHSTPLKNDLVIEKIRSTMIDRYGKPFALQNEELMDKARRTTETRYGVDHISHAHLPIETVNLIKNPELLYEMTESESLMTISNRIGLSYSALCKILREAGFDISKRSSFQTEVGSFIESLGYSITYNRRDIISPMEIDIQVDGTNLLIECNGMYWHTLDMIGSKDYHLSKTKMANELGMDLVHIYDWDWYTKSDILKSIISSRLGRCSRTYARKCDVVIPSISEERKFMNENHFQGYIGSLIRYALKSDSGELVAMMSFSKSRFKSSHGDYEILRYCNKLGTSVVGGASRLYKRFMTDYGEPSVYSYANMDLYTGQMYKSLGMKFIGHSGPGLRYWHTSTNTAHSRTSLQNHKLARKLDRFDPSLTASQNLINNNYYQVWNCGNSIWKTNK